MKFKSAFVPMLLLMLAAAASSSAAAIKTIHFPGSLNTIAADVYRGKVVGLYWNDSSARQHGFIYDGTSYTTIDWPDALSTALLGIDGDTVVGGFRPQDGSRYRGFKYDGSAFTLVDPPLATSQPINGSAARGIHGGNIVGDYYRGQSQQGYLFDGSSYVDLPGAQAEDIEGNKIVGVYRSPENRGYIYDGVTFSTIHYPGSVSTGASGISNNRVVGSYRTGPNAVHGFLFHDDKFTSFDVPASLGEDTSIEGIYGNTIIGSYIIGGKYRGFIAAIPEPQSLLLFACALLGIARVRQLGGRL